MKRLEHSDIVEAVKLAVQQMVDQPGFSFSKADIANRVLAVHPELDRARLDRVIAYIWDHLDPHRFNKAEREAEWEQHKAHAETLIQAGHLDEGLAYLQQAAAKTREKTDAIAADAYMSEIELRVFRAHTETTTMGELVRELGVEGYVAAARAELAKDGHVECVTIDGGNVRRYKIESVLDQRFRRSAEMILGKRPYPPVFPEKV